MVKLSGEGNAASCAAYDGGRRNDLHDVRPIRDLGSTLDKSENACRMKNNSLRNHGKRGNTITTCRMTGLDIWTHPREQQLTQDRHAIGLWLHLSQPLNGSTRRTATRVGAENGRVTLVVHLVGGEDKERCHFQCGMKRTQRD